MSAETQIFDDLANVSEVKFQRAINELTTYACSSIDDSAGLSLRLNRNLKTLASRLAKKKNVTLSSLVKLLLIKEIKNDLIEQRNDVPSFVNH